jgi:hypothetical protein
MHTCILILMLLALAGCSTRKEEEERSSEAGARLIEAPPKTADELFAVTRVIDLETTSESLIAFPFDLCVSREEVFVASRNNEIKVFDMEGKYKRTIGHLGDGPGEYRNIAALFPRGGNEIGVYDWSNLRLTIFSRNGAYHMSAVFGMPGMEGARSMLFLDGHYYVHVPSSPAQNYHLVKLDTSLSVAGAYLEGDRRYRGYQDRLLFNGGIVTDTARRCIYEADSYYYGIRRIDPVTGEISELMPDPPPFYVPLPSLPAPTTMEETLAQFQKGTNVYNIFLASQRYVVLEYHLPSGNGRVKVVYLFYDLDRATYFTAPAANVHPAFADGDHLYGLVYHDKNSRQDEEMVRNPSLIVYTLSIESP